MKKKLLCTSVDNTVDVPITCSLLTFLVVLFVILL